MANQLVTHSLSDPRLQRLDLDVRAAAQSRSSLLINGERDEALLVARLAHEVGVTYCTTSYFVVVGPGVLSEGSVALPYGLLQPGTSGASVQSQRRTMDPVRRGH